MIEWIQHEVKLVSGYVVNQRARDWRFEIEKGVGVFQTKKGWEPQI